MKNVISILRSTLIIYCMLCFIPNAQATIHHVNINATGTNSGTSWTNAFTDLQIALNTAIIGDTLWIAKGTYHPTQYPGGVTGFNQEEKAFYLNKDVVILGGFDGTETQLSQRDYVNNPTILSGDFNGDDSLVIALPNSYIQNTSDNTYHILLLADLTNNTKIDGLLFTGGIGGSGNFTYSGKNFTSAGSAIYNADASPVIKNCIFEKNNTHLYGNSIYNQGNSDVIIQHCIFRHNIKNVIYNDLNSEITIENCSFEHNRGQASIVLRSHAVIDSCNFDNNFSFRGPAINFGDQSSGLIQNSTFTNNTSTAEGGAIYAFHIYSNIIIKNCLFDNNTSQGEGGAFYISHSSIKSINNTFSNNYAPKGGALAIMGSKTSNFHNNLFHHNKSQRGGTIYAKQNSVNNFYNCVIYKDSATISGDIAFNTSYAFLNIQNSIIWDSLGVEIMDSLGTTIANHSIIKGSGGSVNWDESYGIDEGNNLDIDPLFVNPNALNFQLQPNSPAINAGNNDSIINIDYNQSARIQFGDVDIGLYEVPSNCFQVFNANITDVQNCYGDSTGSIVLQITGVMPYTYLWDNGATTQQRDSLPAGVYQCTVTDGNGCQDSISIEVQQPDSIMIEQFIKPESNNVQYHGFITIYPSGGVAPYNYLWQGGSNVQHNFAAFQGTYHLSITDANNCIFQDSFIVSYVDYSGVTRFYVDVDATGGNTGKSWADAFTNLQFALDKAQDGDEVWVRKGIYKPCRNGNYVNESRAREFLISKNIKIYGGFDGTETLLSQRDYVNNVTILSGDLKGDDVMSAENIGKLIYTSRDNAYRVILVQNSDSTMLLDGFTISGGVADNDLLWRSCAGYKLYNNSGGAIGNYCTGGTFQNIIFTQNFAEQRGGAVANLNSTPRFINCQFYHNFANSFGGAVANINQFQSSNSYFKQCSFTENSVFNANYGIGGAVFSKNATFEDCYFANNNADKRGGALELAGDFVMKRCTIENNYARFEGGGMYIHSGNPSDPLIENCVISQNKSEDGGGVYIDGASSLGCPIINTHISHNEAQNGGGFYMNNTNPKLFNCVIQGNTAEVYGGGIFHDSYSRPHYINCNIIDNEAIQGSIYSTKYSTPEFFNSILWSRTMLNNFPIRINAGTQPFPTYTNSLMGYNHPVFGNWASNYGIDNGFNIHADPLFLDSLDFRLNIGSPALNAGNFTHNPTTTDIAGNPRMQVGGQIDIGAYEGSFTPTPTIFGTVAKDSLIPSTIQAVVYLIEFDGTSLTAIATDTTDQTGNFTFSGFAPGQYLVKAALLSSDPDYSNHLPTYYVQSLYWNNANNVTFALQNQYKSILIDLINGNNTNTGSGFIGGSVTQGANKGAGPGDPMPNVQVILLDASMNPITYTYTDLNGDYSFPNLPYGTYNVYIEYLGTQALPIEVMLSVDVPSIPTVDFEINTDNVGYTSIGDLNQVEDFSFYPNPAMDNLNIQIIMKNGISATFSILNMNGQVMFNEDQQLSAGKQQINLSVDQLPAGVYLLQLRTNTGIATYRFVKG